MSPTICPSLLFFGKLLVYVLPALLACVQTTSDGFVLKSSFRGRCIKALDSWIKMFSIAKYEREVVLKEYHSMVKHVWYFFEIKTASKAILTLIGFMIQAHYNEKPAIKTKCELATLASSFF